jgi:hypothetical protein
MVVDYWAGANDLLEVIDRILFGFVRHFDELISMTQVYVVQLF